MACSCSCSCSDGTMTRATPKPRPRSIVRGAFYVSVHKMSLGTHAFCPANLSTIHLPSPFNDINCEKGGGGVAVSILLSCLSFSPGTHCSTHGTPPKPSTTTLHRPPYFFYFFYFLLFSFFSRSSFLKGATKLRISVIKFWVSISPPPWWTPKILQRILHWAARPFNKHSSDFWCPLPFKCYKWLQR